MRRNSVRLGIWLIRWSLVQMVVYRWRIFSSGSVDVTNVFLILFSVTWILAFFSSSVTLFVVITFWRCAKKISL